MAVKRDKSSPWEFLWYALYAFAGLGLELVLMGGVEPALFGGTPPSRYTAAHTLLHWGMTMACWGLTAALLVRQAEKKLGFSLLEARPVPRKGAGLAIGLAALCNLLGVLCVTAVNTSVAETIYSIASFGGGPRAALAALCAAMASIVLWAAAAWWFGIPTSQSHSLIAGLTGAAIAVQGGLDAINGAEWMKVIYGILLSTLLGFGLGWLNYKLIGRLCRHVNRQKANSFFKWAQICSGAGVAFMHGAQDGQKFMSIFMLAIMMTAGMGMDLTGVAMPMWLMIFCAFNMGLGTAVGGERIIKSVGMDMVKLEAFQGFAASLSTFVSLMLATFGGLPVSTTHTNTTAIMGVGAAKSPKSVKWSIAIDMVKTWVLTFPGCGILGFACAKLFLMIL